MSTGNFARGAFVLAACVAAVGSASSSGSGAYQPAPMGAPQTQTGGPPAAQPMDPASTLGLWRSTFGAVKIEADNSKGGIQAGAVHGVWVYMRDKTQEVTGYFAGTLNGNVLNFRWQEPANPPLVGAGYIVFDVQGRQYSGRWWSDSRNRVGVWNGWRQGPTQVNDPYAAGSYGGDAYGGASYGADPYAPQSPQSPYPPQQPQPRYY